MPKYNPLAVEQRYGKLPENDEQALGYLKALKIIIGADGVIAPAEWEAVKKGMKRLGISADLEAMIEAFDIQGATLQGVMPAMKPGGKRARLLIRDAIEVAQADGTYAAEEKAAVAQAASLVGLDDTTVKALEALVEMEHAVKRLRKALI